MRRLTDQQVDAIARRAGRAPGRDRGRRRPDVRVGRPAAGGGARARLRGAAHLRRSPGRAAADPRGRRRVRHRRRLRRRGPRRLPEPGDRVAWRSGGEIIAAIRAAMRQHGERLAQAGLGGDRARPLGAQGAQERAWLPRRRRARRPSCPDTVTGDHGLTLTELAPFGVIGSITPTTNPTSTIICNTIGMVAAGNSRGLQRAPRAPSAAPWRRCAS